MGSYACKLLAALKVDGTQLSKLATTVKFDLFVRHADLRWK